MGFDISYIIATRNRLPFLTITLQKLLAEIQPNEEIVVVDGNSADGAKEYLQELYSQKKINQFVSEPDFNQAHGWNKAMLMAKGTIIKKIIDDDVFCYQAIRHCAGFMLKNASVDVTISNDLSSTISTYKDISPSTRIAEYQQWNKGYIPCFTFSDVHLLVRRSSLSRIGLYNTDFVMMDWEYALRISALKCNIAYYTGYNALSVAHPQTVSSNKVIKLINDQGKRGSYFYNYPGDGAEISLWSKIKIAVGKFLYRIKKAPIAPTEIQSADLITIYDYYYQYLSELNNSLVPEMMESMRKDAGDSKSSST